MLDFHPPSDQDLNIGQEFFALLDKELTDVSGNSNGSVAAERPEDNIMPGLLTLVVVSRLHIGCVRVLYVEISPSIA